MAKNKTPKDLTIEAIKISYVGINSKEEAESLHCYLQQNHQIKVNPPEKIPTQIAKLGMGKILITIVLTSIAKDVWGHILNILQEHFRNQMKKSCEVQINVKQDKKDWGKGFTFRCSKEKQINPSETFNDIDDYITKIKSKSLSEWIEDRIKIDEQIKNLFEEKATFLDIDVVGSTQLRRDEPDLMKSANSFERYFKYVEEKVVENSGKVLNAVGDEVMAWFNTPSDAINCASEIFNDRGVFNLTRNILKNPFQFRIGINTGLALIDEKNGKAFSRGVLDLAGHLQKEADPGTFLISRNTYNDLENKNMYKKNKNIKNNELSYKLKK